MRTIRHLTLIAIAVATLLASCGNDASGSGDAGADTDTDTDTDVDGDVDADTDTDADTDSDLDTDTDADTVIDADTDSDTDSGTEYNCWAEYIYYDDWWGIYYHHGDFVGNCVESSSDCEWDISPSDPSGTCPASQVCCLPWCAYPSDDGTITGWCQYPDQYCEQVHDDIQSDCGDGTLCCPPLDLLL